MADIEIDPPAAEPTSMGGQEINTDALVDELGEILTSLDEEPYNVELIRKQITIMKQLGMVDEANEATTRLVDLIMPNEDLWLSYLDTAIQASPKPLALEPFLDILEKFDRAEKDYLSLAILLRHVEFIILCAEHLSPLIATGSEKESGEDAFAVDEDVVSLLTVETTRGMLAGVIDKAQGLLTSSHLVWQPYIDWEISMLSKASKDERDSHLGYIHQQFIQRLQTCHSTIDQTSAAYSTFCSQYCPEEYESRMVQATEASQEARFKWSGEKRYGQTREDLEQMIAYSTDDSSRAQAFLTYIDWETDPRAKHPKSTRSPKQDPILVRAVFERTVSTYASAAQSGEAAVQSAESALSQALSTKASKQKKKKKGQEEEDPAVEAAKLELKVAKDAYRSYKEAESVIWGKYIAWLDENSSAEEVIEVATRATRACPRSGSTWCSLLINLESNGSSLETLQAIVEKAEELVSEVDGPVKSLVDVILCDAAILNRASEVDPGSDGNPVLTCLLDGLESVSEVQKSGDPSLRIEKYLMDWAENKAPHLLPLVLAELDKHLKSRTTSYQFTILRSSLESRMGHIEAARKTFISAIQRADLDWPEAVYEAFIQFENVYGTIETLKSSLKRVEVEQGKVTKRREKEAAAAQQQQQEQYATEGVSMEMYLQPATQAEVVQANDQVQNAAATSEVPAAVEAAGIAPAASAAEPEGETHLKRDREHTTVLVTGLKRGTDSSRLEAFFSECGKIKESTILTDDKHGTDSALVEFHSVDSIPDALAKDHKKLDGVEVTVTMLWRSTLFVTNFPREADDDSLRSMFSQYGRILQTRWPSRKYAGSRRFCYITMESSAAAQEALVLNGFQMAGSGFPLTVAISDPSVKVKRSDTSNSILFVGGLNAKTTESELNKLFGEYGQVASVKLGWDNEKKICKGFAFVEMGTEAQAKASLALQGTQFHGRYLKVEISDPNYANKKSTDGRGQDRRADAERKARTIGLHNLPPGTQEGLLQQALEKIVPVRRLELFEKTLHAIAELETQADVGFLLLRPEPFVFNGATITFTSQGDRRIHQPFSRSGASSKSADTAAVPSTAAASSSASSTPASSLAFAPRAARRPGKAIGKGRQAPVVDKTLSAVVEGVGTEGVGSTGKGGARGQDDFRLMVAAKNEKRKEKLDNAIKAGMEKQARQEQEQGNGKRAIDGGGEEGNLLKKVKIAEE